MQNNTEEKKTTPKGGKGGKAPKVEKQEEVATPPAPTAIAVVPEPIVTPEVPGNFKSKLSRQQVELIKRQIAKGASDDELKMFLYVCERTGLDPFTKQVHLVPRWDSKLGAEVRTVIVGIDGLRSVAERTGAYAGNTDPEFGEDVELEYTETVWEGKVKKEVKKKGDFPKSATVIVKKIVQGVICDFPATAHWKEYYPGDKGGNMWRKMPHNMLGKCAEAKALRKAFPAVMSGLYVNEEMNQAGVAQIGSPEQKQGALFNSAKKSLEKVTDPAELNRYREGFSTSDKYNDEQKAELIAIIDQKLAAK